MLQGKLSYLEKLTGEDLSRYLNRIESIGLKKLSASAISAICCKIFTFPCPTSWRPEQMA